MNTIVTIVLRQIPWEKLAVGIVNRVTDRYERGKIKRLPSEELLQSDTDQQKILAEIIRRIREGI